MASRVALDCEMVGDSRNRSMLARVSLVDGDCRKIYDTFVKPTSPVGDYRTSMTGITETHLRGGRNFDTVKNQVQNLIRGKLLIGHSVAGDLEVLNLQHHANNIRDIAEFPQFKSYNGQKRSLKDLAKEQLNIDIQVDYHDSLKDAAAAMKLYNKIAHMW